MSLKKSPPYIKYVCRVCGDPELDWGFCRKHLDERNERVRGARKSYG